MRTPVKLTGFAVAVAAVLAASFGVGSAVGKCSSAGCSRLAQFQGSQHPYRHRFGIDKSTGPAATAAGQPLTARRQFLGR